MNRRRNPSASLDPGAVQLLEEAVHLLRAAPAVTWATYYALSAPWVFGFLSFWAYTTWFAPSSAEIAAMSLGLVFLFVAMKTGHALFCGSMLARRLGEPPPRSLGWSTLTAAFNQASLHGWGAVALPCMFVLGVPFGWTYAFFQNASVLEFSATRGATPVSELALREAQRWPGQNHLGLLCLSVVALAGFVNVASAFYLVPWLANRLLGVENLFGLQGWNAFNSTFVACVAGLTWLAVDPVIKTFYVLRVFYGQSQRTGEDLTVDLRRASSGSRRAVLAVLALVCLLASASDVRAADQETTPAPVQAVEQTPAADGGGLDKRIDEVLTRPDFRWQLRPQPEASEAPDGPLQSFFRKTYEFVAGAIRTLVDWIEAIWKWLRGLFTSRNENKAPAGSWFGGDWIDMLLYVLIGLAVALIAYIAYIVLRTPSAARVRAVTGAAVANAAPDLHDESLHAGHLPTDEWLRLAREQAARGEWRLALRALYLATLARLAGEGLIALARAKTNLDYERELKRRAPSQLVLQASFTQRRRCFEAIWYGRAQAEADIVRAWLEELDNGVKR